MNGICICVGDYKELGNLIGDIKLLSQARRTPMLVLDPGMKRPEYLEGHAHIYTDLDKNAPIAQNWDIDLLVATHCSETGRYLVEHWPRPRVKFLYQGLYYPTPEWLALHTHLHTAWGLTEDCVRGFESSDAFAVAAVNHGEQFGPGRRLLSMLNR